MQTAFGAVEVVGGANAFRSTRREEAKLVYLPIRGGENTATVGLASSLLALVQIALLRGIGDRTMEQLVRSLIATKPRCRRNRTKGRPFAFDSFKLADNLLESTDN